MIIRKAFKYRIYPTEEQKGELAKQFGHCRFVYNRYLDLRQTLYKESGESLGYVDCANDLAKLKKAEGYEWLREAYSQALQQSLKDLDRAYKNFFEGRAE